jgi:hypothetical protein
MQNNSIEAPEQADVRFQDYRLKVISEWVPSPRKVAACEAISQRLTSIARCALVRPDIADLLNLSCKLMDDSFTYDSESPSNREKASPFAETWAPRSLHPLRSVIS